MSTDRALRLQVVLQAIDRATAPLRGIGRGGKEAAAQLKATLDSLKALKNQQQAIGEFRKLTGELRSSAEQLRLMRQRVAELRAAQAAGGQAAKAHAAELAAAEKAVARATKAYEAQERAVAATKQRLAALGLRTVAADEARLGREIAETSRRAEQQRASVDRLRGAWAQAQAARRRYDDGLARTRAMAGAGAATTAAGVAAAAPVVGSVKAYASLQDAMLGIARQVPGARDDAGRLTEVYAQLKAQVHGLGREIPLATNDLAEMMAAGARMEVPTEQLAGYTRTAAMMALAFDAVPAEIAEQMGKVGKNFKIPADQIAGLADSINYLDDNAISKGGEIIDVLNRISGVVSTVKMSAADAAALSSTLLTLAERPETAATAINAITQKLAAATKGTKKFQSAVSELGLDSGRIQQGMATDATATLIGVIDAIRKLPESKRVGVMVELVGMEHSDTLAKLVDKPEEFERQRRLAGGTAAQGSMEREFSARNGNLSAQLQMTQNRAFELATTLGSTLEPTLRSLMSMVNSATEAMSRFAAEHPVLTSVAMHVAAALAGILLAAGALMLGLAAVLGPLVVVRYGMALLGIKGAGVASILRTLGSIGWRAMGLLAKGILIVGRALLANPIGLAIAAIATAAYLIYEHWEPIKAFFLELWESVTKIFWNAIDALLGPMRLLRDAFAAIGINVPEIPRFGDAAAAAGSPVKVDDRPPLPAGAGQPRPVVVAGANMPVTINVPPGSDAKDIAREFERLQAKLQRDQAARARSTLHDAY